MYKPLLTPEEKVNFSKFGEISLSTIGATIPYVADLEEYKTSILRNAARLYLCTVCEVVRDQTIGLINEYYEYEDFLTMLAAEYNMYVALVTKATDPLALKDVVLRLPYYVYSTRQVLL